MDDVTLVDDSFIVKAMNLLLVDLGLVVEPAGAAGVAAALAHRERFKDLLVASPLCGGNVTTEQMRTWYQSNYLAW